MTRNAPERGTTALSQRARTSAFLTPPLGRLPEASRAPCITTRLVERRALALHGALRVIPRIPRLVVVVALAVALLLPLPIGQPRDGDPSSQPLLRMTMYPSSQDQP